ncbi:MAG TPA: hypothetical protein VI818_00745 [Candidatus Thermoplasmatota archaeon]|nr:hypothetical protein [Candidatus Thermoplasmatota archaeon]
MRRLALLTTDFSLYHDLVRHLRERKVSFDSLAFGETPGPDIAVVITSWRDTLRPDLPKEVPIVPVPLRADGKEDVAAAVSQALRVLEGVQGYHEVVVGIDPGKRPGVAVLGDGRLLHTAQAFVPNDAPGLVESLLGQFPADRFVVRLGHGAPRERDHILHELLKLERSDVRVEVVDETGTTPAPGLRAGFSADVAAALRIARTPGVPAARPKRHVSAGQIREIQRESRELTLGRFTISRDQARRVARGDLSLPQAVEEEQSVSRRPRSRSSSR